MHHVWLVAAAAALSIPLAHTPTNLPVGTTREGMAAAPVRDTGPAVRNLLRFEPLMGGAWVADGVLSGGQRYSAERRYEWYMDGRFVRILQRLTVDSVTVGEETVIGWDAGTGELQLWSFASDGSFAEGRERAATGGNRWVFEGRTSGVRGGDWRITTLIIDPGAFSVLLEVRDGGDYRPAMTMAYRRVADQAPPRPDTVAARPDTTAVTPDTTVVRRDTMVARASGGPSGSSRPHQLLAGRAPARASVRTSSSSRPHAPFASRVPVALLHSAAWSSPPNRGTRNRASG